MDKRIILAVAGSGKTTHILNQLNLEKRFLIVTYTINNIENLRFGIIKKFGYFPRNIRLLSYFTFIYSFCYRPLLSIQIKSKGIYWERPPQFTFNLDRNNDKFYLHSSNRLYSSRIAKLLEVKNALSDVRQRLESYFDYLYVDEIQDFAGHDFDFLKGISKSNLNITFVGDFFQHTFDTSSDGNVNKKLHSDYESYKKSFRTMGLQVDTESLVNSHRCSITICDFIRKNIGIEIYSSNNRETNITIVDNQLDANEIHSNQEIVKLFYQEHYKYNCYSKNWGSCKGEDKYNDVCIVLNKTTLKEFNNNSLSNLTAQTKNKLYVACSRARNNLYFISDALLKIHKQ